MATLPASLLPHSASDGLMAWLENASATDLDALPFGVIAMTLGGHVVAYNKAEAALSGLTPARVLGRHFFTAVAPCTNNHLIARRYQDEAALDATCNYVFTFRMVPAKVTLRLLRRPGARHMYLVVDVGPRHES